MDNTHDIVIDVVIANDFTVLIRLLITFGDIGADVFVFLPF